MKLTFKYKIAANTSFEVGTKDELFGYIREITRKGYFFEIRNYYNGNGRAGYIVRVLNHKDAE